MLLNVRVCAPDFAMKALENKNDFDAIGQRKFCSCALVFNFLSLLPNGDTTKCLSPNNGKNWGFFANRGRQNELIETKFGTLAYTVVLL